MQRVMLVEDALLLIIAKKLLWNERIDRVHSINRVFGKMQENLKNACVVGLIDDDKTVTAPYSKLFTKEIAHEQNFLVRHSETIPLHSVIVVKPASEGWLWNVAESVGIKTSTFNLGETFDEFRTFTKGESPLQNPEMAKFIGAVARAQPTPFIALQTWLQNEITRTV